MSSKNAAQRLNVAQKLIASHLVHSTGAGLPAPGEEIGIRIDQTLTQDATGTLVMLALEAMQVRHVSTEISVQYVDHNLIQEDYKNPDDHLFLESACQRFGLVFSRPGTGVSHPVHMQSFGKPGKTLLGSDSHTCASGALGMLAIGAGGLAVAMAMAGHPFHLRMPKVWGVELVGSLPDWVSAKDVILELLRRHSVSGGVGRIIEYHGEGLEQLSLWDRHVIANMGAELGATTTVFPSDQRTREFLRTMGRESDWEPWVSDPGASYDVTDRIDLAALEPLIAKPSSPDNVVPVREVAGTPVYQSYLGSSANPGFRDFAIAAHVLRGRRAAPGVSLDVNPSTREVLLQLIREGVLSDLVSAGARLHQVGCNGCIGMGQAPATGRNSVRTVPRNFPGRSGTKEDSVWLASPETAAASALTGRITDPRGLGLSYPRLTEPARSKLGESLFLDPPPLETALRVPLVKGPNIASIPAGAALPEQLDLPVLLKVGDNLSTDEILPAGARVLPLRSNIPKISDFAFEAVDPSYPTRARKLEGAAGHAVVGGRNYGQGSSREHAALAPRYLGLRAVLAVSFARIHRDNLINYGVLPLVFADPGDAAALEQGDLLRLSDLHRALRGGDELSLSILPQNRVIRAHHGLSPRQVEVVLAGGLIPWARGRERAKDALAHPSV